jgi:c(7)-type cytochrome triheme protein
MIGSFRRFQRLYRLMCGRLPTQSRVLAFAFPGVLVGLALVMFLNSRASGSIPNFRTEPIAPPSGNQERMQFPEGLDYSRFLHSNGNHSRLPCLLCHRREGNSARPAFPGSSSHLPCAGCHVKQFADSANAICTICHSNAQSGALKTFPGLSSFNMKFDHAGHTRMGSVGCATCHRPSRGGVAMTIPAGLNAHVTCYQCHGPQAKSGDKQSSSCSVCHDLGHYVRTREMASAFRVGFSHAKHNKDEGLSCNDCHRVRAGVAQRIQVTAPQPLNHHASAGAFSCMSCHNGKRAFGGDDSSVCTRCHTGSTWHF